MSDLTSDELRALARGPIALTERPSEAAVTLHDVRVALEQAAFDRAALDRVRALLTKMGTWDLATDASASPDYWEGGRDATEYIGARLAAAIRDEHGSALDRTDWVDDAAPLPRPDGSSDA